MGVVVKKTNYSEFPLFSTGKVRDVYDLGESLLVVVTDRLSAFDHILPNPIPDKGRVLNLLSAFWFEKVEHIIDNHLVSRSVQDLPEELDNYRNELNRRFMIVKKARMLPVECIVRGYISGSAWAEYKNQGSVSGIKLKSGMKESGKFDEPLFTPSTKAESGHDENISFEKMEEIVGKEAAEKARSASVEIYRFAAKYALEKGIIIADTKFEFGYYGDELILCDEALTPDSSRFWPLQSYEEGKSQPSFDKQFVRDYLLKIGWNKAPPAPELPEEVVLMTSGKYKEAYLKLTGQNLPDD